MARFSLPIVQIGAALGAGAMVAVGQWLGAASPPETPASRMSAGLEREAPTASASAAFAAVQRSTAEVSRDPSEQLAPRRSTSSGKRDGAGSTAPIAPALAEEALAQVRPRLSVIIDDVGHDAAAARALMALPVTLSILPYADAAPQLALEAQAAGREVFLHLPMEPVGLDDPGPGAITTALPAAEIARRVEAALARVPGAAGLNNHMGSRATRDAAAMAAVFGGLSRRDLIFVDSLTHPASLAGDAARAAGFESFDRDVFLDAPGADPAAQLDAALSLAVSQGRAIAIGHPYPATLDALAALQAKADAAGVELVTVSALGARAAPS